MVFLQIRSAWVHECMERNLSSILKVLQEKKKEKKKGVGVREAKLLQIQNMDDTKLQRLSHLKHQPSLPKKKKYIYIFIIIL